MQSFLIALQFLTRLPVFTALDYSAENRINGVLFYPLIGLIIGLLLYGAEQLLASTEVFFSAAIILSLWVMITGGLHLDGLADSADAWAGGLGDRQRSLDIMKDPRCGAIAVIVLILYLLLKFVALVSLLKMPQADSLILVPMCARAGVVLLLMTTDYARKDGLGREMAEHMPVRSAIIVLLLSLIFLFFWAGPGQGLLVLAVLLSVYYLLRKMMLQRLGGMTGDTAGALIEITELFILLGLVMAY